MEKNKSNLMLRNTRSAADSTEKLSQKSLMPKFNTIRKYTKKDPNVLKT